MDVKIDSLIPFDLLRTDLEHVFSVVEKNDKVVLLKDNKPAYIVLKYDGEGISENIIEKHANYTLQEAMKIVLSEADNKTMHASELADEIYKRKLYLQKNGKKHSILRTGQGVGITRIYLRPSTVTISN